MLTGEPLAAIVIPAAALGLVAGSFVTALTYRWPRGESIAHGRSKCASCGHQLTARDLVPLLSWLANRGRCRHCGAHVSRRYPAIEAAMLGLFVADALTATDLTHLGLLLLMTATMMALGVVDLEHRRLPNGMVGALAALALAWRWETDAKMITAIVAAIVIGAVCLLLNAGLRALNPRSTLGMGDIKLLAVGGLALAPGYALLFVALAGILGVLSALLRFRRPLSQPFPFGPAILLSLWLTMVAANYLLGGAFSLT